MVKIWAKAMKEQKIIRDVIFEVIDKKSFEEALRDICYLLDAPVPLVLTKHIHNFKHFNQCKFLASEFVESIDFDELVLENATETDK